MLTFIYTHVHNCIIAVQVWLNILWAAPALILVHFFFSTELITELSVRGLFHSRRKRLPSRCCSVALFTTFHLWKFSKHVMIFFTWGFIQQPTWVNWHSPLLENPCRGKAISSPLFTVWLGETFPSLLWVRTWSIFRWAWSSTSTWTSAMKQTMERTIDEKARVLKTERVFDVSITQL